MKLEICPTCSCSLVRVGIKNSPDLSIKYEGEAYFFCCYDCMELFKGAEERFLAEIKDLIACPVCLAEKQIRQAVTITYNKEPISFCRCPHCINEFTKRPQYYVDRLDGKIAYEGIFNNLCCENNTNIK